jgi:poly(A) polymerase
MRRAARRIVEKLRQHGHEAFFAGGWVRDYLLRRKAKDIDIATSATPEQVLRLFPRSVPVGAEFGVIQVRSYGRSYEVATFRREGPYLDGRHPSKVEYTGPKQDALRRDFTINGLFYDPIADRVIDYVHGRNDLQHRLLRTIGDPAERFTEDNLRMLRAIRLACNLGFQIVPATWEAIVGLAPGIARVSWERIRDELLKILTGIDRARALDMLAESGLLKHILPEVDSLRGPGQQEPQPENDVFAHTRAAVDLLRNPTPVLSLGTLLHDVARPCTGTAPEGTGLDSHAELGAGIASDICRRLRLSNEELEQVVGLVRDHLRFIEVRQMRESTLKRFLRRPDFSDHLELHRANCLAHRRSLDDYDFCREKLAEFGREGLHPPALIGGQDLIDLGFAPGPLFSGILREVEDLQLENVLKTREEALEHVRRSFRPARVSDRPEVNGEPV